MDPSPAPPSSSDPDRSAAARPPGSPPPRASAEGEIYAAETLSPADLSRGSTPAVQPPAPAARTPWEDRPWFVLAIVFGAALFLGYPLLWRTKAFQRSTKIWLSLLVMVETVVLFTAFYYSMRWSYLRVVDSLE